MHACPAGSLLHYLEQVPDPRGRQGRRFSLSAMLATVVCAVMAGHRHYSAIAQWIRLQPPEVWHLLGYHRKPPGINAFRNLLMALSPQSFEDAIRAWMTDVLGSWDEEQLRAIAMDGKTLRGTLAVHGRAIHQLSLFDQKSGCVLSQMQVDPRTNESKAALEILRTLVLQGRVITGDAIFCQREICQQILDSGGHYFFVVKDNQPTLKEAVTAEFEAGFSPLHRTPTPDAAGRIRHDRQRTGGGRPSSSGNQHASGGAA